MAVLFNVLKMPCATVTCGSKLWCVVIINCRLSYRVVLERTHLKVVVFFCSEHLERRNSFGLCAVFSCCVQLAPGTSPFS